MSRVAEIESSSFASPWNEEMLRGELTNPTARGVVAERDGADGEIVAFALFWVVVDEVHLLIIAVDPACRRRGIARQLMDEVARRGLAEKAALMDLEVRPTNVPARELYEGLGFREVGRRKRYYADREDALIMRRPLCSWPWLSAEA